MTALKRFALGGILLCTLPGCFHICDAMERFPSLELTPNSATINAPGSLTLKSDGLGNGCGNDRPRASSVAFYADGVRIGGDSSAPFEVTWQITPGKDGIPTSGSKTVNVYAVINLNGLDESRRIPVQVNVTAATNSR